MAARNPRVEWRNDPVLGPYRITIVPCSSAASDNRAAGRKGKKKVRK